MDKYPHYPPPPGFPLPPYAPSRVPAPPDPAPPLPIPPAQQGPAMEFDSSCCRLSTNSTDVIDSLTNIAAKNRFNAAGISAVVQARILSMPPPFKLPFLYLLDSIAKNVGPPYVACFAPHVANIFTNAYAACATHVRVSMSRLLSTWIPVFGFDTVSEIQHRMASIDAAFPNSPLPPPQSLMMPQRMPHLTPNPSSTLPGWMRNASYGSSRNYNFRSAPPRHGGLAKDKRMFRRENYSAQNRGRPYSRRGASHHRAAPAHASAPSAPTTPGSGKLTTLLNNPPPGLFGATLPDEAPLTKRSSELTSSHKTDSKLLTSKKMHSRLKTSKKTPPALNPSKATPQNSPVNKRGIHLRSVLLPLSPPSALQVSEKPKKGSAVENLGPKIRSVQALLSPAPSKTTVKVSSPRSPTGAVFTSPESAVNMSPGTRTMCHGSGNIANQKNYGKTCDNSVEMNCHTRVDSPTKSGKDEPISQNTMRAANEPSDKPATHSSNKAIKQKEEEIFVQSTVKTEGKLHSRGVQSPERDTVNPTKTEEEKPSVQSTLKTEGKLRDGRGVQSSDTAVDIPVKNKTDRLEVKSSFRTEKKHSATQLNGDYTVKAKAASVILGVKREHDDGIEMNSGQGKIEEAWEKGTLAKRARRAPSRGEEEEQGILPIVPTKTGEERPSRQTRKREREEDKDTVPPKGESAEGSPKKRVKV